MPAPQPKKTHPIRRLLGLKRVLALNVALFALVAWAYSGEAVRNRDMQVEVERLQAQAAELTAKNAELADLGKRIANTQVLEREARMKLNLRKPGEEVVVVTNPGPIDATTEQGGTVGERATEVRERERGNLARWWRYFFR